jgi:HK97 family phage prohead protease
MQKKYITGYVTKSGENKYKVLASTSAVDRQGDSIDQTGWDLSNFKKNPVMPWAHNYDQLPVAKATSIEVTMQGLECDFEFAPVEGNPMAQQCKILYDEGFLNAVSVGFIPKTRAGNVITSAELLEISFVPVPANQEALRLAVEKGIDISIVEEAMKGEVADQVAAEEMVEAKYENLSAMFEIVYAMCDVYMMQDTPVENFSKLLTETVGILQQLADGETDDNTVVSASIKEKATIAIKAIAEKSGRTISAETMKCLDKAMEHIMAGHTVLDQLKTASAESGDGKTVEVKEEVKVEPVADNSIELLANDLSVIRKAVQVDIRQKELVSSLIKNLLDKQAVKV